MLLRHYNRLNLLNKFTVNAALAALTWFVFFYLLRFSPWVHPFYELLTEKLTTLLLQATQLALALMGEEALIYKKSIQQIGGTGVYLNRGCLGRNLMGLAGGFILIFPGNYKTKLWYIPLVIAVVCSINVLRVVGLYLTNKYYPQHLGVDHHALFNYVVYACTFVLWYVWIKFFRLPKTKQAHAR